MTRLTLCALVCLVALSAAACGASAITAPSSPSAAIVAPSAVQAPGGRLLAAATPTGVFFDLMTEQDAIDLLNNHERAVRCRDLNAGEISYIKAKYGFVAGRLIEPAALLPIIKEIDEQPFRCLP